MFFKNSPVIQTVNMTKGRTLQGVKLLSGGKALMTVCDIDSHQQYDEIWDLDKNKCLKRLNQDITSSYNLILSTVSYSKNKLFQFENASNTSYLNIYNLSTNKLEKKVTLDYLKFPRVPYHIVLLQHEMFCVLDNKSVSFWNMDGKHLVSCEIPFNKNEVPLLQMEELQDGNLLTVLTDAGRTFLVNTTDQKVHIMDNEVSFIFTPSADILQMKSLPNSLLLMTVGRNYERKTSMNVWDPSTKELLFTHIINGRCNRILILPEKEQVLLYGPQGYQKLSLKEILNQVKVAQEQLHEDKAQMKMK